MVRECPLPREVGCDDGVLTSRKVLLAAEAFACCGSRVCAGAGAAAPWVSSQYLLFYSHLKMQAKWPEGVEGEPVYAVVADLFVDPLSGDGREDATVVDYKTQFSGT